MKTPGTTRRALTCALGVLAAAPAATPADRIPITTSSEQARQLYLKGRDLSEKLRATDGRAHFLKAVELDADFALAHYGVALSAATASEFFAALAVQFADLADKRGALGHRQPP